MNYFIYKYGTCLWKRYPLNYGYIFDKKALDDEPQDEYILGVEEQLTTFTGKVIAVINRLDDNEDKLVVCDINKNYTNYDK